MNVYRSNNDCNFFKGESSADVRTPKWYDLIGTWKFDFKKF